MEKNYTWLQESVEQFIVGHVVRQVKARNDFPRGGYAFAGIVNAHGGFIEIEWYYQKDVTDFRGRRSGQMTFSVPRALRMFMVSNDEEMQDYERSISYST